MPKFSESKTVYNNAEYFYIVDDEGVLWRVVVSSNQIEKTTEIPGPCKNPDAVN